MRNKHNPWSPHGQNVSTLQRRHVFTRRISEACGIDLHSEAKQMRSIAEKCDVPPQTGTALTADSASTRGTLTRRVGKY
ncbi:hypothetical protein DPMN_030829, partial [Dreissena polymorpha]